MRGGVSDAEIHPVDAPILVIIPTYNERETLGGIVAAVLALGTWSMPWRWRTLAASARCTDQPNGVSDPPTARDLTKRCDWEAAPPR
jgi:hypothetical protein